MDVIKAVVEFGTSAVLRYREMSQGPDNAVPECFLSCFITQGLYDRFQCGVRLEPVYTHVTDNLGVPHSPELTNKIGQYRGDVALYENGLPRAVIELKLFDEAHPLAKIEEVTLKLRKLGEFCRVPAYIGVLICETDVPLEEQIQRLEAALQRKVHTWTTQRSRDGRWRWCFGCSLVSERLRPEGVADVA